MRERYQLFSVLHRLLEKGCGRTAALPLLLLLACPAGCDSKTRGAGESKQSKPKTARVAHPELPVGSAQASASQTPDRARHPLAGRWRGAYKTSPVAPSVPAAANWDAWGNDDEKKAVGSGKVDLRVASDGSVLGTLTGPLGALQAVGAVDGPTLRLGLGPKLAGQEGAMRGFALIQLSGERLRGHLQVSDSRGQHPRRGTFILKR